MVSFSSEPLVCPFYIIYPSGAVKGEGTALRQDSPLCCSQWSLEVHFWATGRIRVEGMTEWVACTIVPRRAPWTTFGHKWATEQDRRPAPPRNRSNSSSRSSSNSSFRSEGGRGSGGGGGGGGPEQQANTSRAAVVTVAQEETKVAEEDEDSEPSSDGEGYVN